MLGCSVRVVSDLTQECLLDTDFLDSYELEEKDLNNSTACATCTIVVHLHVM